jgi:transposase
MLSEFQAPDYSEIDLAVFDALVRRDHPLRLALRVIDFQALRQRVVSFYSDKPVGRRPIEPLVMIKLEMLMYRDRLSDRQVIERAAADMSYRLFLGLGLKDELPDPSSLTYFRARLGEEGYRDLFTEVVAQAKSAGVLKERLRITDCTHLIADMATPATLELLAQIRNRLLTSAAVFDSQRVAGERLRLVSLRESTRDLSIAQRLAVRVTHCRELVGWMNTLTPPTDADTSAWQRFQQDLALLGKVLGESEDPQAGDRTRSAVDPDARRGRHGAFYDGYRTSTVMDADSEIITNVDAQPANSDEAAGIPELIRQEEAALGTDVESLSIDGAGFNGPVLRELQDPDGLNLNVIVPAKREPETNLFTPQQFLKSEDGLQVTCPAGQTSQSRQYDQAKRATTYRFAAAACANCPLLAQCMAKAPAKMGRTVRKSDYEVEHQQARAKAETAEYQTVRREHPAIERKQSEMIRQHGCRRARYRGLPKVRCQMLMTALVTNVKRLVKLLGSPFVRISVC